MSANLIMRLGLYALAASVIALRTALYIITRDDVNASTMINISPRKLLCYGDTL